MYDWKSFLTVSKYSNEIQSFNEYNDGWDDELDFRITSIHGWSVEEGNGWLSMNVK